MLNPLTKEILCKDSGSLLPLAQIQDPSSTPAPATFTLHLDSQHSYPSIKRTLMKPKKSSPKTRRAAPADFKQRKGVAVDFAALLGIQLLIVETKM